MPAPPRLDLALAPSFLVPCSFEAEIFAPARTKLQSTLTYLWGDRIFEKCGIRRDEGGDGGKTLEIRGKQRLSARDEGANYQQS